jgi:hypothetical protein
VQYDENKTQMGVEWWGEQFAMRSAACAKRYPPQDASNACVCLMLYLAPGRSYTTAWW